MRPTVVAMLAPAILAFGAAAPAWAQNGPIQRSQLPPLQEQSRPQGYPASPRPPVWTPGQSVLSGQGAPGQTVLGGTGPAGQGVLGGQGGQGVPGGQGAGQGATGPAVPTPDTPGPEAPDQTQAAPQAPSAAPPAPVERPNIWVPAAVAKLQALDKVNAQASELTIKVGQAASFGSLTITVKSCMIRPPNQPADAAAYLDITDSHPDSPGFDGWMLQDEPSVSMMQHPIYDLRVTGCA